MGLPRVDPGRATLSGRVPCPQSSGIGWPGPIGQRSRQHLLGFGEEPRLQLWRIGVQAGLTQGSSPAKGVERALRQSRGRHYAPSRPIEPS